MKRTRTTVQIVGVLVVAALVSGGCELDDPNGLRIDDVIAIAPVRATLDANGVDRTEITATLGGDTPNGSDITFATDAGSFAGVPGTGTTDGGQEIRLKAAARRATVFLTSSVDVTDATVSATVGGFTAFTKVSFTRVLPVRVLLTSNVTRLPADGRNTATLTATLVPPGDGTVSRGTRVFFIATDSTSGASVPALDREALSNGSGVATTSIVSQQAGMMRIVSTVEGASGVTDTLSIEFE